MIMLYNNAFVLLRKNKICVRFVLARDIYICPGGTYTHAYNSIYLYYTFMRYEQSSAIYLA
jgi:hypothetical protein